MKRSIFTILFLFIIFGSVNAKVNPNNLKRNTIYSTILKENRELQILLPNEFKDTYFTYPAIYILDAEINFNTAVEVLSFLMDNHFIPPQLVVGIMNTDRLRDMTPVDSVLSKTIFPTRGGADSFLKVLKNEIIPFVDKNYRTNKRRMIIGHNYSGLLSVHAFLNDSDLFDKYMAFSPILWWNDTAIVSDMEKYLSEKSSLRKHLFISFAREAKNMLEACKGLTRVLEEKSPDDLNWKCDWMPDEDHYSLYRKSLMNGMEYVFKNYKYPDIQSLATKGVEEAKRYQRDIMLNYGRNEKLPYSLLESVCLQLKQEKKYQNALLFLKYTLINYPDKAEPYYYVGEIYEAINKPENAIEFYEVAHKKDMGRWDYEQKYMAMQKLINEMKNHTQSKTEL